MVDLKSTKITDDLNGKKAKIQRRAKETKDD